MEFAVTKVATLKSKIDQFFANDDASVINYKIKRISCVNFLACKIDILLKIVPLVLREVYQYDLELLE